MVQLTLIVAYLKGAKEASQWIGDGQAVRCVIFSVQQALSEAEQCLSEMKTLEVKTLAEEKREKKRRNNQKTTVATLHQIK
jgi:hypothetical protein